MNIYIYMLIFFAKVLENALATLRLIVVANGKKQVGAILNFMISIVWVISTGYVVIDVLKDPLKILVFALGSYVGSLVGSIIEEKLAMGSCMIMVVTEEEIGECMVKQFNNKNLPVTTFKGKGNERFRKVLMIVIERKRQKEVISLIKECDKNALIIVESANSVNEKTYK